MSTGNYSALLAFGGCQFGVSSRRRRAGQGQRESCQTPRQPLAPRSICAMLSPADCYIGCIPSAKRDGLLLRPSPLPCRVCGADRRSRPVIHPSSGNRAATAEGWARPSLMVGHVGARYQRAQDRIQIHQTAQSALAEEAPKARRPMLAGEEKGSNRKPIFFHLNCEPKHNPVGFLLRPVQDGLALQASSTRLMSSSMANGLIR